MGAVSLQLVDKDNRDVCSLSGIDPSPNCGLASALCLRMLPRCPGQAWLNRSCLAGTVVGWLVPMVQLQVLARVRAEWRYRLLSCPESAAAVEQLGAALAAEQLVQPAAEGAARQPTAAAATAASGSNSSSSNSSSNKQQSRYK